MAENPKHFLRDLKAGIGESQLKPDGSEVIAFEDYNAKSCRLVCDGGSYVVIEVEGASMRLSMGQAQRFINSIERWVRSTNFGKMEHEKPPT